MTDYRERKNNEKQTSWIQTAIKRRWMTEKRRKLVSGTIGKMPMRKVQEIVEIDDLEQQNNHNHN
jgi:hypothetical protein